MLTAVAVTHQNYRGRHQNRTIISPRNYQFHIRSLEIKSVTMTTNALKCKCKPDNEITVSSNITATIIDTMTTSSATTILDLPIELIEQICCYDSLKLIDVFNLAVSHPKLNNCLLGEPNSCLWKSKFIQKYTIPLFFTFCFY